MFENNLELEKKPINLEILEEYQRQVEFLKATRD